MLRNLLALGALLCVVSPLRADPITLRADVPSGAELYLPRVVPDTDLSTSIMRRANLAALFHRYAGEGSDQHKVIRVTTFLQGYMYHPRWAPLDARGNLIVDPEWLIETRLGQCGQTNRLLVDLLAAGGYRARVVQLYGHVTAEVFYDGGWHWLDADSLSEGQFVMNERGVIASAMEIANNPDLLGALEAYAETSSYPVNVQQERLSLREAFARRKYTSDGLLTPFAYVKTATPEQELDQYYGWAHYQTVAIDCRGC